MGEGNLTYFWEKSWVGSTPLKFLFPKLYNLCTNKLVRVSEMGEWEGENWRWYWQWRIELFEREHPMLNTLIDILNRYSLKFGINDHWHWRAAANGTYTTKSAYDKLLEVESREKFAMKEEFNII